MSAMLLLNLDMGGTPFGTPVGPGAGRELMLIWVGRCFVGALLGSWCFLLGGG